MQMKDVMKPKKERVVKLFESLERLNDTIPDEQMSDLKDQFDNIVAYVKERYPLTRKYIAKKYPFINGSYRGMVLIGCDGEKYTSYEELHNKYGVNAMITSDGIANYCHYVYAKELDALVQYEVSAVLAEDMGKVKFFEEIRTTIFDRTLKSVSDSGSVKIKKLHEHLLNVPVKNTSESLMCAAKEMFGFKTALFVNGSQQLYGKNNVYAMDNLRNLKAALKLVELQAIKVRHEKEKMLDLELEVGKYNYKKIEAKNLLPHETKSLNNKIYMESLAKDLMVVRYVHFYKNEVFESKRVYISNDKVLALKSDVYGNWYKDTYLQFHAHGMLRYDFSEIVWDDIQVSRVKHVVDFMKNTKHHIDLDEQMRMFLGCAARDIIEQLTKLGLIKDMIPYADSYDPDSILSSIDRVVNLQIDGKNIYQKLGINKYQYDRIIAVTRKINDADAFLFIGSIKRMMSGTSRNSISHINNEIFDMYLELFVDARDKGAEFSMYDYGYLHDMIKIHLSLNNDKIRNRALTYIPTLAKMNNGNQRDETLFLWRDYLHLVNHVGLMADMSLFPQTREKLVNYHDRLAEAFNVMNDKKMQKMQEEENARFLEIKDELLDLEFKFGEYKVVAPKTADEIRMEGRVLKHCVGSYVSRVLNKETKIYFLRKTNDTKTPFFTVEVNNENKICQAHGFANSNATDGIIAFLKKWAEEKELMFGDINQVR